MEECKLNLIRDENQSESCLTVGQNNAKIPPADLTPRDDVKKVVSEVLKRVDNLIRKGDLDQAERCVLQAREIDPSNIYAYAYEERIQILKEQAHQNELAAVACKISELGKVAGNLQVREEQSELQLSPSQKLQVHTPVQVRPHPAKGVQLPSESALRAEEQLCSEARKQAEEEYNFRIQRMVKEAVETSQREIEQKQPEIRAKERDEFARQEQLTVRKTAEDARLAEEQRQAEIRRDTEERLITKLRKEYQTNLAQSPIMANPGTRYQLAIETSISSGSVPRTCADRIAPNDPRQNTLSRYKFVLSSVWADGAVRPEEEETLKALRATLSISMEEHACLEKEVKYEAYIGAFKKAWNSGSITPENVSILGALRQRFQISDAEHLKIESKLLWEIQPAKNRPTLLVVDDDEKLLNIVSRTLNEAGFVTTSMTTSDQAYAYLKESSPDLILCDVNLETSTMGGFAFYEKVRELDRLQHIPFIFLSGLSDEVLVRTGKELGVDDYLSKPVSEQTLISTIKGKLRRYQELKKRSN